MEHTVEQGECCSHLGAKYGIPWKKIWNHAKNADLKAKRKSPDVLFPGDSIFIPDLKIKEENCATDRRHKFKRKIDKVWLRLRLLEEDKPRRNLKYTLKIGGDEIKGTTDGDGKLEHKILPIHTDAWLKTDVDVFHLQLGALDPVEEDSGVEHRLQNLGFLGQDTTQPTKDGAVKEFKKKNGLGNNENLDDPTKTKLHDKHGS